jgi:RimJ/RimL family protein N-acetyltransferase
MNHFQKTIKMMKDNPYENFIKISMNKKNIFLRSVDLSQESVSLITNWRNQYWHGFLTKFEASEKNTLKWLDKEIIQNPERILFFIILKKQKIGHVGIMNYNKNFNTIEIDNVLRGVRIDYPGLMENVLKSIFNWLFKELKLSEINLKVFSDNYKAINLYERSGMITIGVIPLKRIVTNDGWEWIETKLKYETEWAERYLSIMKISKDYFKKRGCCNEF